MKKYIFFLVIFNSFCFSLFSQDLITTTRSIFIDETGTCNPGEITVNATNSIIFPISLKVTSSPNNACLVVGAGYEINENEPILNINIACSSSIPISPVACAGEYCFRARRGIGTQYFCETNFCVTVGYCRQTSSSIRTLSCLELGNNDTPETASFSGTNPIIYGTGSSRYNDTNELESDYTYYTNMSNAQFGLIADNVIQKINDAAIDILDFGNTPNLVANQSEVNSDEDFIFKFDGNGNVLWVYHKNQTASNSNNFELPIQNTKQSVLKSSMELTAVYPNPFDKDINLEIRSEREQEIEVSVIDLLGNKVKVETSIISKGDNRIQMTLNSNLSSGIYLINIRDEKGVNYNKQIIHSK